MTCSAHRTFLACAAAGAVGAALVGTSSALAPARASEAPAAAPVGAPNILLINTDDQRADTLSVMPRVQAFFGQRGTTYTNASVTTSLCTPSRSTMLSGRYSHNTGITGNGMPTEVGSFDQSGTIEAYLQAGGYQTAMSGKFLNTYPLSRKPEYFNNWAFMSGGYTNVSFNVNGKVTKTAGNAIDRTADYAVKYLDQFEANDAAPWFLYVAPEAPHAPYTPAPKYANAAVPAWVRGPDFNEPDISDKPPSVQWRGLVDLTSANLLRTQQLRTLMSVDDLVGRIVDELGKNGELSNTLAIYTSDNGYLWGEHRISANKRFPYLPSIQVPLLVSWPGHVGAGLTSDQLVTQADFMPTFLQASGVTPVLKHPLDGRSLLTTQPRAQELLEYFKSADSPLGPWAGLRSKTWEYVEWYNATTGGRIFAEYYNLVSDPYQLNNLLGDKNTANDPNVASLHAQLLQARSCVGTACP